MHPILFTVFNMPIYAWGVFLVIGLISATVFALFRSKKYEISSDTVIDLVLYCCISAIIMARLTFVVLNWNLYSSNPISILYLKDGGLAFLGGLLGGVLAAVVYCKVKKLDFWKIADFAAPSIGLAYAIGRIGCLFNGCCYGVVTTLPWAIHGGTDLLLRHPTQIYASISGIIIMIATLLYDKKKKAYGQTFLLFVMIYSVCRFIIEFFRMESVVLFNPFTMTQIVCAITFIAAFMLFKIFGKERSIQEGEKVKVLETETIPPKEKSEDNYDTSQDNKQ